MGFAHLHTHSFFSFLDGGSSVEDLVRAAAAGGVQALALTDHDNVCGAVDFHRAAQRWGVKPIQGAELTLKGGYHLVVLADGPRGYANLCRLLSRSHLDSERKRPRLDPALIEEFGGGLFALSGCRRGEIPSLLLRGEYSRARRRADFYRAVLGDRFFLEIQPAFLPGDRALYRAVRELGEEMDIGVVGSNNVHYARKADFRIHDLLTCVREGITLSQACRERPLNAENYLKTSDTMMRYFSLFPEAARNTGRIAAACEPALVLGEHRHPPVELPRGLTAGEHLRHLVYEGARRKYGRVAGRVRERLEHELKIIDQLGYAEYFLLVEDVVRFAREKGIRHAGRGSAADSAVAYCLGITEVDAVKRDLLFERFMSPERGERPDIDIDFDSRRRDEVTEYVYEKYGSDHVAAVATFNTFRARSAVRELGRVMEYDERDLDVLAKTLPVGSSASECRRLVRELPEFRNLPDRWERYEKLFDAVEAVAHFPRHIGTHLGGLVICDTPVEDITPLQRSAGGRLICQFDRDGVEDLGLLKLDLLSLRTLSAVDDAVKTISARDPGFDYDGIPSDDRDTFSMIQKGETIGVFQLESSAQRSLQARLGADSLEDLICSVALIRPGPVKGDMVEPFIARRRGDEPVTYIHPSLEPILKKTFGVVLFQEQVIEIAVAVAGFTPGEADRLRWVMSHNRWGEEMEQLGRLFVEKARERGLDEEVAQTIFSYMEGYASYGFCEAHAAAFGTTAYRTAYLVRHHPAEFYAATLSNQPMGYYPPNSICTQARRRGIVILPVDINRSERDFTVEEGGIRISLGQVRGMDERSLERILSSRPFSSFAGYLEATRIDRDITESLILSGAFTSLEPNRRSLLWRLPPPGWSGGRWDPGPVEDVRDFTPAEKVWLERQVLGIDAGGHIISFLRPQLRRRGVLTAAQAMAAPAGQTVRVAGVLVRPHRPPTRSGRTVVFLSLEDETGLIDVTVFSRTYERYGHLIFSDRVPPLMVTGKVQRRGKGVSVTAGKITALT
ncbi:MAG: DNA polymerase III subunit alpha [Bacillota bacterium]